MKLTMLVNNASVGGYLNLKHKLPIDSILACNVGCATRLREQDREVPIYVCESQEGVRDVGVPTTKTVSSLPVATIAIIIFSEIDLMRVLAVGGIKTIFLRRSCNSEYTQREILVRILNMISDYDEIEYLIVEAVSLDDMAFLKGIGIEHFLITPELCYEILG